MASDLRELRGVGPRLESSLNQLGIQRSQDLLFHLPFRYEDRTRLHPIGALYPGARVLIEGEVGHSAIVRGRRAMLVVVISDGTGRMTLRFFHFSANQQRMLEKGNWIRCYGEVRWVMNALEMIHPEFEVVDGDSPPPLNQHLTPVYPTTEGLGQGTLRRLVAQALSGPAEAGSVAEPLPQALLDRLDMPGIDAALRRAHRPPDPHRARGRARGRLDTRLARARDEPSARLLRSARRRAHRASGV